MSGIARPLGLLSRISRSLRWLRGIARFLGLLWGIAGLLRSLGLLIPAVTSGARLVGVDLVAGFAALGSAAAVGVNADVALGLGEYGTFTALELERRQWTSVAPIDAAVEGATVVRILVESFLFTGIVHSTSRLLDVVLVAALLPVVVVDLVVVVVVESA